MQHFWEALVVFKTKNDPSYYVFTDMNYNFGIILCLNIFK